MKRYLFILLLIPFALFGQTKYYVATTGDDSDLGTISEPFATFQHGVNVAQPGDTVFFRGGTYMSTSEVEINPEKYGGGVGNSGTHENPIVYMSYPGEWAIFDCSLHCNGALPQYNSAIDIQYVEYITFKDFEIRNVSQCDSVISGAIGGAYSRNLTFDHLIIHNIAQRAFSMLGGAWLSVHEEGMAGYEDEPYWPTAYDSTYFINCDIYDLCDTLSSRYFPHPGNNADGFKVTFYKGNYVEWRNCRIWNYSDDAVDASPANGATFAFYGNWIMSSRKYDSYDMEGNGLKMACFTEVHDTELPTGRTIVKNNLAIYCKAIAYANNLFINGTVYTQDSALICNNVAFRSGGGFNEFSYTDFVSKSEYFNNLGYDNDLYYTIPNDFYGSPIVSIIESHNTMDFVGGWPGWSMTDTVTVTDADFVGLSGNDNADSLYLVGLFTHERQSNGNLPSAGLLRLAEGSDLIGAGTNVGMSTTPDIGIDWAWLDSQGTQAVPRHKIRLGSNGKIQVSSRGRIIYIP
jgi:hypothetical protein